ncbi:MAG: DUF4153 domain-containing protein [Candidatus Nanopelagicales bacterium]
MTTAPPAAPRSRARGSRAPRPLAPVRSLKAKLGVLVVGAAAVTGGAVWFGISHGWSPVITLLVALVLALALTQFLAHGMIAPIRQLTAAARQMASGQPGLTVEPSGPDEVGELVIAFNQMSSELAAVERNRRDLLINIGHELRTPVAALSAQLENLVDGVTPADRANLASALSTSQRVGAVGEDLLGLARAADPRLVVEQVAMPQLLESVAAEVTAAVGWPAGRIRVAAPPELTITADPNRLRQAVANVVDNAVRHGPDGPVDITVYAASPDRLLLLDVRDSGPGIPLADRERVFDRFARGDGDARITAGTGLGLAIARWAVELHGGSIRVLDGADSVIRIALPYQTDGALMREVPRQPARLAGSLGLPGRSDGGHTPGIPAPTATTPVPEPVGSPAALVGPGWSEPLARPPAWFLPAACLVGLLGGILLFADQFGLGVTVMVLACAAPVIAMLRKTFDAWAWAFLALTLALGTAVTVRDLDWLTPLVALAALGAMVVALGRAATCGRILAAPMLFAASALLAIPWAGRSERGRMKRYGPWLRAGLLAAALAVLYGLLFAGADAAFAELLGRLLPSIELGTTPARMILALVTTLFVLGAGYLGAAPMLTPAGGSRPDGNRARGNRIEWLLPLGAVIAMFVLFLAVQAASLFGGSEVVHDLGITYAERARSGFGQLVVVTLLTLGVIGGLGTLVPVPDRRRFAFGGTVLGVLALVVTGSALWRLQLYQQAYGFTVERLLGGVFEVWMALILVLMVTQLWRPGAWLPRVTAFTAAATLLLFVLANPAGIVAGRNIDRFHETGKLDVPYLASLPAGAVPQLMSLPGRQGVCAREGWLDSHPAAGEASLAAWNFDRARASTLLDQQGRVPGAYCQALLYPGE